MPDSNDSMNLIAERLGTLLSRLDSIDQRLAEIDKRLAGVEVQAQQAAAGPPPLDVSEETALAIAAAVAAYLGKRPRIKHIRLLGSAAWAQQGRVFIQASHGLVHGHGA
ncbi:MAG: hypothetical protein IT168_16325 [Bryobacterales bacterium]|nr:hypothetical protein [Bryobacterales bacterium]